MALIMENRGLKDPKVDVKSYLKNIIALYEDVTDPFDNNDQEYGLKSNKIDKYSMNGMIQKMMRLIHKNPKLQHPKNT